MFQSSSFVATGALTICGLITIVMAIEPPVPTVTAPHDRFADPEKVKHDLSPHPLNLRDKIDRTINEEIRSLRESTEIDVVIEVSDTETGAISYPSRKIVVSRPQLERLKKFSDVRRMKEVIRLILAHEMSHQVQYKVYGPDAVLNGTDEERRVYECQADILAGKYLIESFEPDPSAEPAIMDALQVSFDLGTEPSPVADHPTPEGRRAAIRRGMAAGMLVNFRKLPETPEVGGSMQLLAAKADVEGREEILPWSLRQARRIVHCHQDACSDITFSKAEVNLVNGPFGPALAYSFSLTNKGIRPIESDLEVRCDWVQKRDSRGTKRRLLWSSINVKIAINPQKKQRVQGVLPISGPPSMLVGINPAEYEPKIIIPPEDLSLYSCTYTD